MFLTYLGQCGFLIEIGGVRIVTDPYLSSYVDKTDADGKVWRRSYPAPYQLNELKPDIILISHSHGDHMDPLTLKPYIDGGGQAVIAAPAPECGLIESLGAKRLHYAVAEEAFSIKDVVITPIACAHTELHTDDLGRYRELSYAIRCGDEALFFGGDMSLYPGLVERLEAESFPIVLLPANGRDEERTRLNIIGNINCKEAAELASHLGARVYIPMHHDLYIYNGCSNEEIERAAEAANAPLVLMKPGERKEFSGGNTMEDFAAAFHEMMQKNMRREQQNKVRSFRFLNSVAQKGGVLFTGSSLMEQFPIVELARDAGLDAVIYNRGIGGTTSDDFLREIDTVLLDLEPKKVFLNIGTNDMTTNTYGDLWMDHLIDNYEKILQIAKVRIPEAMIHCMAYYPTNRHLPNQEPWQVNMLKERTKENIAACNARVQALAEKYGYRYIDANAGLTDERGEQKAEFAIDGVHMYADAYKIVFDNLKQYI